MFHIFHERMHNSSPSSQLLCAKCDLGHDSPKNKLKRRSVTSQGAVMPLSRSLWNDGYGADTPVLPEAIPVARCPPVPALPLALFSQRFGVAPKLQ
jgi:hypothetical protein